MLAKLFEKETAIKLREQGRTYSEIQKVVPVSKASLSLWLKDTKIGGKYLQKLIQKRYIAQLKGAQARRQWRLDSSNKIIKSALNQIGNVSKRELMLIGAALYWAEGQKQKETGISRRVSFSNSDPYMIKLFILWLKEVCNISFLDIKFDLYIHESGSVEKAKKFWFDFLKIKEEGLKVYFKRHKITRRKNIGDGYHGLIRVSVRRSTNLNRRIAGWIKGISVQCGVV